MICKYCGAELEEGVTVCPDCGKELAEPVEEIAQEETVEVAETFVEVVENPVEEKKNEKYVLPRDLKKGDKVYIVNIDKEGVLLDTPDRSGTVTVQAGILKTRTKLANLRLIEEKPQVISGGKKKQAADYHAKVNRDFRDEIDLRGLLGDEAWLAVDKYLDEAVLANFSRVRLIHGKGTGALRNALWGHLKTDRRVASFRLGKYGEGDGGVTIVEMK